jgi:hypothetical protein
VKRWCFCFCFDFFFGSRQHVLSSTASNATGVGDVGRADEDGVDFCGSGV